VIPGPARGGAVHQVLATLGYGDAIGNQVLGIQRVLRAAGYRSDIFVETADPRLEPLTRDFRELPGESDPDHVLIHHFSIGSKASRVAYALPDRMILVYHNITPPQYFVDIHKLLARFCYHGRRELGAYVDRCDLALGDSEFNRQELQDLGFARTGVLPVVADFSHLDVEPNDMVAGEFDDGWTNILFVGRVIPNKRIEHLIRFYTVYKTRYNPRSRLLIVGSSQQFERYQAMLFDLVGRLGVSDVHFTGHVSNEELTAYYDVADVFLCASEHEGFCVPLVEAFYKRIPVLAWAKTAVPATMDGAGVLYENADPGEVAALVDLVVSDADLQARILRTQDGALERMAARHLAGALLPLVARVQAGPRPAPPVVADDFWQQFDTTERVAELRLLRPAIYRALPTATRASGITE
jgi:glycosyltransferase involved in cell wall biosynthesis